MERAIEFLLQQQAEFAGNLQHVMNVVSETQALVRSLAQMQIQMLERMNDLRQDMERGFAEVNRRFADMDRRFAETDRRFAETDRRFAETDERIRRLADLIERGFRLGNGSHA